MWLFLVIYLTLNVVTSFLFAEIINRDENSIESLLNPDENFDSASIANDPLNQVEGSFGVDFQDVDLSLDPCSSDNQGSDIYRRSCQTDIIIAKTNGPQQPRKGVTLRPPWLGSDTVQETDPQCVNFWKRPILLFCGDPEAFTSGYDIYDSVLVMNCCPSRMAPGIVSLLFFFL